MSIKVALEELFTTLELIHHKHRELDDTAVRERIQEHMLTGLSTSQPVYDLDADFAMFSEEGNRLVRAAMYQFLNHPSIVTMRLQDQSDDDLIAACKELDIEPESGYEDMLIVIGLYDRLF